MKAFQITNYYDQPRFSLNEFEDAIYHSARSFSMQHLIIAGITSQEDIIRAIEKAMLVCSIAGIDSSIHFKKIYVHDVQNGVTYTDWMMTKKGFNLILIQYPHLNEKVAQWLLELVESK